MELTKEQKEFLIDSIVEDMAQMLIDDTKCKIADALDIIYNSETYEKLCDFSTGLASQSAAYNYAVLQYELKNGKVA